MSRLGTRSASAPFPRSLLASASIHALLLATGLAWGVLVEGGGPPSPRVYALRFDEPRPEAFPEDDREPIPEEPRADDSEPELAESESWDEPVQPREPAPEPAPRLRSVDWIEAPPLEIASLPSRVPEPAPAAEPPRPPPAGAVLAAAVPSTPAPGPVVVEPSPLDNPPPAYPRLARRAGEEGSVLCQLRLGADGSVEEVEVVESSGHSRLDAAALEALRHWRFRPRLEDGRAVPSRFLHRVTFQLEG